MLNRTKRATVMLFFLMVNYSFGQSIEQKALDYLVGNIHSIPIKTEENFIVFNKDSNTIFYANKIQGDKSGKKLILKGGRHSRLEGFYKLRHDDNDIFIVTTKSVKSGTGYIVRFEIFTNYDNKTKCLVLFDDKGYGALVIDASNYK